MSIYPYACVRWRDRSLLAIVAAAIALTFASRGAEARTWEMYFEQVVDGETNSATISCSEEAKELCRQDMKLSLDGQDRTVSVVAWTTNNDIFIKFYDNGTYLWVGSQPFAIIPIWDANARPDVQINLRRPSFLDQEDSPDALLHRSVERGAGGLATVVVKLRAVQ